jgi:hypothetical protein
MIVFFAGSGNLYVVFREALHLDGAARLSERGYSNMMVKIYHLPYTANICGATSNHLLIVTPQNKKNHKEMPNLKKINSLDSFIKWQELSDQVHKRSGSKSKLGVINPGQCFLTRHPRMLE